LSASVGTMAFFVATTAKKWMWFQVGFQNFDVVVNSLWCLASHEVSPSQYSKYNLVVVEM
jgi:hypothetical protein